MKRCCGLLRQVAGVRLLFTPLWLVLALLVSSACVATAPTHDTS